MAETVASLHDAGYQRMIVKTETNNQRALDFYESHGFARTEQSTEDVAGESVPVWQLLRTLG